MTWLIGAMFFTGLISIQVEVYADSQDWMEKIICDTESAVTSVAIGDADNDDVNEFVVGLWSPAQQVIAYEKSGVVWEEDVIVSAPAIVYSVAIGDCDNDGSNDVVIGMVSTTNEVRAYKYEGGMWVEDIIADTPNNVYDVAIGDADNDGKNEVVIGLHSSSSEVRSYEKSGGIWVEDVVVDAPTHVRCVIVADCDNDGKQEIVIGMDSTTNEVRAYEKSAGIWVEDVIANTPNSVYSAEVGDCDNDEKNEVVIGLYNSSDEVRAYEKSGGIWVEDVIANPPKSVYAVDIGDCDNDGNNEVVIGMVSTQDEVRAYEKGDFGWKEDIISDTSMDVFSLSVGDADFDGENEVVIGMWTTTNELRLYEYDAGNIEFISHKNGEYVRGKICLEVAVTSSVKEVRFYLNDEFTHVDSNHPYQYLLDTRELMEDGVYSVKAECIRYHTPSQYAFIDIRINNEVKDGNFITVDSLKASYEPDQVISVLVGTNSPPDFTSLKLQLSYADPNQNSYKAVYEALPYSGHYIVGLPLFSDASLGTYTLTVKAFGYDSNELIWNSTGEVSFDVMGKGVHERLDNLDASILDMNSTLCQLQSDLSGMGQGEILAKLEFMNQTLQMKVEDLFVELANLNESILLSISDAQAAILTAIYHVNTSLSQQLLDLSIATEDFYSSIGEDLTEVFGIMSNLEANLSTQHNGISNAIVTLNDTIASAGELSASDIMDKINSTIDQISRLNQSLSTHDEEIKAVLDSLIVLVEHANDLTEDEILGNIAAIIDSLSALDSNITSHVHEVNNDLDNLVNMISDLESLGISELHDRISNLAYNTSHNDDLIRSQLIQTQQSIEDFQDKIDSKLVNISKSLEDLFDLDDLVEALSGLEDSTQSSGNEKASAEEESSLGLTLILVIFGVIMAIVLLGLLHLFRENRMLKEILGIGSKDIVYVEEEN